MQTSHLQRFVWCISSVIIFICSSCPRCSPPTIPLPSHNPCPFLWLAFSSCFFSHFFFVKLHAHIQSNIYLKLMPEAFHYCARKNIYFCSASVVSLFFIFTLGILFFSFFWLFSVCKCAACRFVLAVLLVSVAKQFLSSSSKLIYFNVVFILFCL